MAVLRVDYRTVPQLIEYLREEAFRRGERNRSMEVDSGQRGLIVGRLRLAFGGDDQARLAFLKEVFGIKSSHQMTRAQYYALRDWLIPPMDLGETITKHPTLEQALTAQGYAEAQAWLTGYRLLSGQLKLPDEFDF